MALNTLLLTHVQLRYYSDIQYTRKNDFTRNVSMLLKVVTVYLFRTPDIDAVGSTHCFTADNNALQLWICHCWTKWIGDWYDTVLETRLNVTDKLMHTAQSVTDWLQQLTEYFLCRQTMHCRYTHHDSGVLQHFAQG